ncbi:enhancer of polycomb-like-domain-containing protein [Zopfochytrium polystomum]|nr:enhancer of polycomb-like-domain-containing protein [Zopfochytrium polystomum]
MPAPSGAAFGSLRSRKVDLKKPLPVLRWSDCPDLDESASLNRAIPVVATGVEKEEEDEHHLKVALNANEAGVNKATLFIPTPDASRLISDYDKFYRPTFSITKSLIKFSAHVEDLIGCSYCLDEEDDEFLADYRTKCKERIDDLTPADELSDDLFELLMTGLERVGGEKFQLVNDPVTWEEAVTYMKQNEPFLHYPESAFKMVFTHWQRRRYRRKPGGGPIMPTVKLDEIGPNPESDPYICFRRREIRPVRKSKRPDTGSLDKLRRLRDDLCRVRTLLEYVAEREHAKKEALLLEKMIFEQRVLVRKIKKKLGVSTTERDLELASDARKKKKGDEIRATKIKIPLQKLKEAGGTGDGSEAQASDPHAVLSETAVIEAQVKKRKLQDEKEGWLDLTEDPFCPLLRTGIERRLYIRDLPLHLPLSAPSLPSPPPTVHSSQDSSSAPESFTRAPQRLRFARRRVGRGGRICIDRHIRQADWLHGFGSGAVFVNSVEEEKWMARARRWQFDDSDEEIEDLAIELDESARLIQNPSSTHLRDQFFSLPL